MARVIIERIAFQYRHARFDIETHVPSLTIWGESGAGKTFLWKAIRDKAERGEEGYERFICLNHKTDSLETLIEKIKNSEGKIFIIDDTWRFTQAEDGIDELGKAVDESSNQFIFLGSDESHNIYSDTIGFMKNTDIISSKILDFYRRTVERKGDREEC